MQRRHVRGGAPAPHSQAVESERTRTVGRSPARVAASPHIRAIFGRPISPAAGGANTRRSAPTTPRGGGGGYPGAATGTSWGNSHSHTPRNNNTNRQPHSHQMSTPRGSMGPTHPAGTRLTESVIRNHRGTTTPSRHTDPTHHSNSRRSHQHPQSQQLGRTPGGRSDLSTGSNTANLTNMIADAMSVRMQSMADLRYRIEELTAIQAKEEASLHDQWSRIQQQSEQVVRSAQEETEHYYETQLEKERSERLRAIELMKRFRSEGEVTMRKLKEALQEAQSKWKEEVDRNSKLTTVLKQFQASAAADPASTNNNNPSTTSTSDSDEVTRLKGKLGMLTSLLEEEDAVVMELQCRNKVLEHGMSAVLMERDRLTASLNEASSNSESLDQEYGSVLQQLNVARESKQAVSQSGDHTAIITSLEGQFNSLNTFTALLVKRLKNEQRQRLVSEEQSARVASAQEQMIKKLESRVKELQTRRPASPLDSPRVSEHRRTPVDTSQQQQQYQPHIQPDSIPRHHQSSTSRSYPHQEPVPTGAASHTSITLGTDDDDESYNSDDHPSEASPPPTARAEHALKQYLASSGMPRSPPATPSSSTNQNEGGAAGSPRLEAYRAARAAARGGGGNDEPQAQQRREASVPLEERLAAVSADFNYSIDELTRNLGEPTPAAQRPDVPALRFSPSEERYFAAATTPHEEDFDFDPEEF